VYKGLRNIKYYYIIHIKKYNIFSFAKLKKYDFAEFFAEKPFQFFLSLFKFFLTKMKDDII